VLEQLHSRLGGQASQPPAEAGHVRGGHGRAGHGDASGAIGPEQVHDAPAVDPLRRNRRLEAGPLELAVEHAVVPLGPSGVQGALLHQDDRPAEPGELVRRVRSRRTGSDHRDIGSDQVVGHPDRT
jgi:hypothetical protein